MQLIELQSVLDKIQYFLGLKRSINSATTNLISFFGVIQSNNFTKCENGGNKDNQSIKAKKKRKLAAVLLGPIISCTGNTIIL